MSRGGFRDSGAWLCGAEEQTMDHIINPAPNTERPGRNKVVERAEKSWLMHAAPSYNQ